MNIERWFQGVAVCGPRKPYPTMIEPGTAMAQCLWTQAMYDRLTPEQIARLGEIIVRLFSARVTCQGCEWSPTLQIIHFNNHPETTREDIDKLLGVFNEEQDAHALR